MSNYRRTRVGGASYFFTLIAYRRRPILCDDIVRQALRNAVETTRKEHPFSIDAWVVLPDHLHCIWTLPPDDADFPLRWSKIKRRTSMACREAYRDDHLSTPSRRKRRESTLWQRRYWEHMIRDEDDFVRHMDYIHYNPVKHGLAAKAGDWPYSTFHRLVANGTYPENWAGVAAYGAIRAGE
ncbi:transposase [Pseudoxanthomonas helianthi]|uniref:Transposase n=1 Tax=Pseudoxanthomonas helianthi TaxID=1453541 RepID=A0A940X615_9GAMM|nr:transposase [Pseudoxanthomonas helianthi]MBP3985677.1 transposase [Pseudoxanthomonas helianthi]